MSTLVLPRAYQHDLLDPDLKPLDGRARELLRDVPPRADWLHGLDPDLLVLDRKASLIRSGASGGAGGFKTFAALDPLYAADVMDYLMRQAIAQVTSGTRPSSPVEGQHIDESDTERLRRYDGTNWRLRSPVFAVASYTAGNITLASTSAVNVQTGLDLTLPAVAGDRIEYSLSGIWNTEAVDGHLDVMTVTGSNYFVGAAVSNTQNGHAGWFGWASQAQAISGSAWYTVVSGDISGGNVVLRLRYAGSTSGNKIILANTGSILRAAAVNHGPAA